MMWPPRPYASCEGAIAAAEEIADQAAQGGPVHPDAELRLLRHRGAAAHFLQNPHE